VQAGPGSKRLAGERSSSRAARRGRLPDERRDRARPAAQEDFHQSRASSSAVAARLEMTIERSSKDLETALDGSSARARRHISVSLKSTGKTSDDRSARLRRGARRLDGDATAGELDFARAPDRGRTTCRSTRDAVVGRGHEGSAGSDALIDGQDMLRRYTRRAISRRGSADRRKMSLVRPRSLRRY